jgi:DNA-binding NtrC family response regulator
MNTVLIYAEAEHLRDAIKTALCNHIPLITTENAAQCLEALKQKAPIHKAIVGVSDTDEEDLAALIEGMLAVKPGLKVIAIGNKDSEEIAIEAVHYGASGYLLMPIKAEALLTTLR